MANYFGTYGNDTINGSSAADYIFGDAGHDALDGGAGNDTIDADYGNDTVYGGDGNDLIYGYDGYDGLYGGVGNDTIYGENNNDTVNGGAGDDELYGDWYGGIGQDVLTGGPGTDILYGGNDNDQYFFTFNSDGMDHIYDSQGDYDYIRINGVTNISQLTITTADAIGHSANNLLIYTDADAADYSLSEYIEIYNFYSNGVLAEGRIELLNVNGTNYALLDQINHV